MQLSNKHQRPATVTRSDFSGGLNTTNNVDGILENQISSGVNVGADHSTGRLKSVARRRNFCRNVRRNKQKAFDSSK